jgi:AraC-like DNA-binding protein
MQARRRAQSWRHQPIFRRPRHFHDEPEVNLVVSGSARIGVGDRVLSLSAGQAAVLHPGQDHELLAASEDLDLYVFAVKPELAAREPALFAPTSAVARFDEQDMTAVVDLLRGLSHVTAPEALERGVMQLWSNVIARSHEPSALAQRSYGLLRDDRSVSQARLAERLKTSPSELSRAFHRSFGVPMVQLRSRLRLLEFIRLADAGESLTRAALNADFGSYAQCFRAFRRSLGCSPTEYFAGARHEVALRLR